MAGIGDLAYWWQLRGPRPEGDPSDLVLPPGDGPLVLMCGGASDLRGLAQELRRRRPGLRLGALGPVAVERGDRAVPAVLPAPPSDPISARLLVEQAAPAALVLTDGVLPAALIAACDEGDVPITLVANPTQLAAAAARRVWRGARRGPVTRLSRVLVPDEVAHEAALREGIAPQRIEVIGTAAPILPPLRCNMRELAALRPMLRDRRVWLAASLPLREVVPVLAAQENLLSAHHRALLIIAPVRAEEAAAIADAAEARGLAVALREAVDPGPDIQVLVAEDSAELGLWYRLASVTYMGGTLTNGAGVARHPFEPAALGSAIVHGPHLSAQAAEWQGLDRAGGARRIHAASALPAAIEDLSAPDAAARLARSAWEVSTAGAEITRRIADAILSDLPEGAP